MQKSNLRFWTHHKALLGLLSLTCWQLMGCEVSTDHPLPARSQVAPNTEGFAPPADLQAESQENTDGESANHTEPELHEEPVEASERMRPPNAPEPVQDTDDPGPVEVEPALYGETCDAPGPYPTSQWATALPEDEGMDSNLLLEAAEFAAMNSSQCVIVARHGRIVGEWYWNGTGPNTPVKSWSVAKSYASTVAGIAISRGDIESVNDPVADYVPEWQGTDKESVTIRHLLSMSSGLEFNLLADNVGISLAKDMTKKALENPLVNPPGALWEYNNHTVQMIEPVLRAATGMAPDEYAAEHMFVPMGMNASWKRDKQEQPAMYMNVHASCRDHLKFGYLFLRNGCWDGDQLIDESFVKEATTPSTQMNRGYGYWWWLNGEMPTLSSIDFEPKTTVLQPGVPSDAYCALGLGNQIVEVIPSLDMVIVRFGPAPHENLDLWAVQDGAVMDALMNDDVQEISYGVVQRVVQAVVTE